MAKKCVGWATRKRHSLLIVIFLEATRDISMKAFAVFLCIAFCQARKKRRPDDEPPLAVELECRALRDALRTDTATSVQGEPATGKAGPLPDGRFPHYADNATAFDALCSDRLRS